MLILLKLDMFFVQGWILKLALYKKEAYKYIYSLEKKISLISMDIDKNWK